MATTWREGLWEAVFGLAFSFVCVLLPVCGVKGLDLVVVLGLFYCVVLCWFALCYDRHSGCSVWCFTVVVGSSIKGSRSRAVYGAQTTKELKLTLCCFLARRYSMNHITQCYTGLDIFNMIVIYIAFVCGDHLYMPRS